MVNEIASRLLVVIDDDNYNADSFIKYGPVRALENEFGDGAICVLHREDINIRAITDLRGLDSAVFSDRLGVAFSARVAAARVSTAFNPALPGHVTKLVVGLIQHYGALTSDEIDVLLYCLGVSITQSKLLSLLLCAEYAEWVAKEKRGLHTYFVCPADNEAVEYKLRPGMLPLDKLRWRADILEYWKTNDAERFNSIRNRRRQARR